MLLQIKRIFVVGKKGALFWLHEIILWLNVPTYTGLMFSFIFSCVPREKIWDSSVPGHCVSVSTSLIATSVLNVLSDVTMLFLPVAVIMQLHLPTRSKIILSAIFGTGVLYGSAHFDIHEWINFSDGYNIGPLSRVLSA